MKTKLVWLFALIWILLTWFFFSQNSIKNIDTIDTVRIPNSWWTNSGSISKSLSTEDKIGLLISEADVVKKLKKDKNDYFLEELPKIETYSTSSPSFEYFILKSVKENKVDICNGINDTSKKNLCIDLFWNQKNTDAFVKTYVKSWENVQFAESMYKIVSNIRDWINSCEHDDIIAYLACKKVFDNNYDVLKTFIRYARLDETSTWIFLKDNYKDIINYWGEDKGFIYLIENSTLKRF